MLHVCNGQNSALFRALYECVNIFLHKMIFYDNNDVIAGIILGSIVISTIHKISAIVKLIGRQVLQSLTIDQYLFR